MKLMLLLASVVYLESVVASLGNTFPTYKSCVETCRSDICSPDGYYFSNPELTSLPLLLLWKCSDDCHYRCMWGVVDTFQKKHWPPPQFHGKWPFVRFLGIQEPASTLFSLLNLGLHAKYFSKFIKEIRYSNPMFKVWVAYALISMNGWMWSTIFHTRDTAFTELMDYLSAFGLVFSSAYGICMRLLLHKRRIFSLFVTILCFIFYANHALYLSSGMFDYKYNLIANIIVGAFLVVNCVVFIVINRTLAQTKPLSIAVTTISAALYLEIIDFPPYFWILDAHALWHLLTAPVTHYFWRVWSLATTSIAVVISALYLSVMYCFVGVHGVLNCGTRGVVTPQVVASINYPLREIVVIDAMINGNDNYNTTTYIVHRIRP